ncbi:hypothetical protein B0H10DRAFT_2223027 [Mycena sp. CBHHK59/15]|nr:hypothetical protein B0H10DRAFT_2223027 [Mycena sp. CBHHK59/15]
MWYPSAASGRLMLSATIRAKASPAPTMDTWNPGAMHALTYRSVGQLARVRAQVFAEARWTNPVVGTGAGAGAEANVIPSAGVGVNAWANTQAQATTMLVTTFVPRDADLRQLPMFTSKGHGSVAALSAQTASAHISHPVLDWTQTLDASHHFPRAAPFTFACPSNIHDASGHTLRMTVKLYHVPTAGIALLLAHRISASKERWEPTTLCFLTQHPTAVPPIREYTGASVSQWADTIPAFLRSSHIANGSLPPPTPLSPTLILVEPMLVPRAHFYVHATTVHFVVTGTLLHMPRERTLWRT